MDKEVFLDDSNDPGSLCAKTTKQLTWVKLLTSELLYLHFDLIKYASTI